MTPVWACCLLFGLLNSVSICNLTPDISAIKLHMKLCYLDYMVAKKTFNGLEKDAPSDSRACGWPAGEGLAACSPLTLFVGYNQVGQSLGWFRACH